jgi:hypothetical protein
MLVPLYGFVAGDVLGLVVLVHDHQTIAELATVMQEAASMRVAAQRRPRVRSDGRLLDPAQTVASAGLTPLARVDLIEEGS